MTQEEKQLDIPEFLKGQTKEYLRIEKSDYRQMIDNFNQARHLAFMRGIFVGFWATATVVIIITIIAYSVQYFSFGVLPMAGP